MAASAAVKIQSIFRGWRIRKRLVFDIRYEFEEIVHSIDCELGAGLNLSTIEWNHATYLAKPYIDCSLFPLDTSIETEVLDLSSIAQEEAVDCSISEEDFNLQSSEEAMDSSISEEECKLQSLEEEDSIEESDSFQDKEFKSHAEKCSIEELENELKWTRQALMHRLQHLKENNS